MGGLIKWIKKEIESSSRQRRLSAPAAIAKTPNQHRDEAYLKAISKFNEWRNSQRFEQLNETKNASAITQAPTIDQSILTEDFSMISDVVIDESEKRRLIEIRRDVRRHEHKAMLISKNHRLSLPVVKTKSDEKTSRRKNRKSQVHPSTTIDEIEEFEQNHCGKMDEDFPDTVKSPPRNFFRDNTEPFPDVQQRSASKELTPRRSLMGRNMLQRKSLKGRAPQPPSAESETYANFQNGSFKHYDVNSASIYDEFVISSKAYKGSMRKQQPEKINSVGESASSGSLSSDAGKAAKKLRRYSPPYQTVINKHGDEVEYALPYNERDSLSNMPPLPDTPAPGHAKLPPSHFEHIINENFKFLNAHLNYFNAEEAALNQHPVETPFEPIDASFSDIRRQRGPVTDLDNSGLGTPAQSREIIKELDTLSKWTKNLKNCDQKLQSKSVVQEYMAIHGRVKLFDAHDLKYKSGILRNSFSTPLEFSTGYFRSTPVTLRSTLPNVYSLNSFADVACKREFKILTEIRHQSIATLMGISHDNELRVMSLIMEQFDYSLNHYLHQMDEYFSIQETITIVRQIANATQYLHDSGIVHSNISSHAVLVCKHPFAVKLSCFELATEILPTESIGTIFQPQTNYDEDTSLMMKVPADAAIADKFYKLSKQHFYNRTSLPSGVKEEDNEYRLPYSVAYRRMFSMHFYQPPELLVPSNDRNFNYVFPSTRSDIYGLALLLWEALNHCVPFVIFNHDELIEEFNKNEAKLPLLDKGCTTFMDIFESCLRSNASERLSDVFEFILKLDEVFNAGDGNKIRHTVVEPVYSHLSLEKKKNLKNAKLSEKMPEKKYFTMTNDRDLQKRSENAITLENLKKLGQKDSSRISESMKSSEFEAQLESFSKQPKILQENALERIKKSVEDQKVIAPKKPIRQRDDVAPEVLENSQRSLTNSTMYHSFFDFNRLHTPKVDKNGIYERTSTLKKRLKVPEDRQLKKSVKGLFDHQPSENAFDKMNNELSQINQHDFMNEIVQELNERQKMGQDEAGVSSFLNCAMANNLHEQSRSFEELSKNLPETPKIKRSESDNVAETSVYKFAMGDYQLPKTPIARQNKIRRNAWLSDTKKPSGGRISDYGLKLNKSGNDVKFQKESPVMLDEKFSQKQYNVNIKIHHNDLDKTQKQNDSSISIQLRSPAHMSATGSPLIKVNNVELNNSRYPIDINKKYYPMMPEMLSDVIQNKRDRSGFLQTSHCDEEDKVFDREVVLREKSKDTVESLPRRRSVREVVQFMESNFQNRLPIDVGSPNRVVKTNDEDFSTPTVRASNKPENESSNEMFFTPSAETPKANDNVNDCLMQASESIQKLNNIFAQQKATPVLVHKRLENVINQTPTKITTKVTLNLQKLSRRSTDVDHLKQMQDQSRHSICNNAELIKRIQMHFKNNNPALQDSKNNSISASCSSLVPRDSQNELATPGKCQKYFCRNCGFTMLPAEVLQRIQSNGRLSIASSLTDGLQSIKGDDRLQPLLKCLPITETRSIEDLYIDDDFCQGIHQSLAANMELMPSTDFFESFDFNFMTAEFLQTREHEFDNKPTYCDQKQLDWRFNDENIVEDLPKISIMEVEDDEIAKKDDAESTIVV